MNISRKLHFSNSFFSTNLLSGTSDFPLEVLPSKNSICRTHTSLIWQYIVVYSGGMHLYQIVTDLFAFLILMNFRKFN